MYILNREVLEIYGKLNKVYYINICWRDQSSLEHSRLRDQCVSLTKYMTFASQLTLANYKLTCSTTCEEKRHIEIDTIKTKMTNNIRHETLR